jgi:hypothetical protein
MQVFFTTEVRSAPILQGGELIRVDWQRKAVVCKVPIVPDPLVDDPNPRGGTRGGRGVALFDGRVIAASYHTLNFFDYNLRPKSTITNGLLTGLHEVYVTHRRTLWVSSTDIDAALEIDIDSGHIVRDLWPREMPGLQRTLALTPLKIDKSADNRGRFLAENFTKHQGHLHFNTVSVWRGEIYALFNTYGVIANLDRQEVVIRDAALHGAHNLIIQEDGTAIANGSISRTVRTYDLNAKCLLRVIELARFPIVRSLARWRDIRFWIQRTLSKTGLLPPSPPRPIFARGMDLVGDQLFVGIAPATILCLHWPTGDLIDFFNYSQDVHVCVHGVSALDGE